jgi:hypothetical protein
MNNFILWIIMPSNPVKVCRRFGEIYRLNLCLLPDVFSLGLFLDTKHGGDKFLAIGPRDVISQKTELFSKRQEEEWKL